MISLQDFTFTYAGSDHPALANINLRIDQGEFVLVSGASGSGKSTLCRCFNGLVPHFHGGQVSGKAEVQGLDILKHSPREMAAIVGMVFQDPENQIVSTTVEREIAFGLENLAFPRQLMARRIEEALDTLGLAALRKRQIRELSGGQKQKIVIASVLALHPQVLVLDEPTSELDPQSAEDVLSVVRRLNEDIGLSVILIEHRLERALPFCERLLVMEKGRIILDGPTAHVLKSVPAPCDMGPALPGPGPALPGTGVSLPPVARLARRLPQAFLNGGGIPLTVKNGRLLLQRYLENKTLKTPPPLSDRVKGEAVLRTEKLDYIYPEGTVALHNINLTIGRGEFVAIMGRNASGKSTLVRHFNGLLKPTRGKVFIQGSETSKKTVAGLAGSVGLVLQDPNDHLFADTVEDEIAFVLKNLGMGAAERAARIEEMLADFGLDRFRLAYPRSLSGGEKQRVALASVMAADPDILVLDEPTRGLEQRLKAELMGYLTACARRGKTIILVSHDVETVAEYADRVVLMSEGEIVVDGEKHAVLSRALLFSPQINRLVQSFEKQGLSGDILTVEELLEALL